MSATTSDGSLTLPSVLAHLSRVLFCVSAACGNPPPLLILPLKRPCNFSRYAGLTSLTSFGPGQQGWLQDYIPNNDGLKLQARFISQVTLYHGKL
mmetsp:Transcript_36386/g.71930  ORF Transcript_36386/g.71930 Transcript_36386/m.71930 type:complete len:95 (-) Transcript_36386:18-302(-)